MFTQVDSSCVGEAVKEESCMEDVKVPVEAR